MANSWGNYFKVTTFGESHGAGIGVIIDGCPAGLELHVEDIQKWLDRRRPGSGPLVSPRQETDQVKILSGIYHSKTTGASIAMIVENHDAQSQAYEAMQQVLRPGHANYTYWKKWNHFDPRGGGRASARETIARVCAGAVADKILKFFKIHICAYITQIGSIEFNPDLHSFWPTHESIGASPVRCPDASSSAEMVRLLESLIQEGDSIGGKVQASIRGLPSGLGEPIFDRFEAKLAQAMLSLPASKAFSMGDGFSCVQKKGSEFNDLFLQLDDSIQLASNHSSGTLGGITTGETVHFQVAFKPTSSIRKPQETCDLTGKSVILDWPNGFRHDPCVAIRACPVIEAMAALVTVDFLLAAGIDTMDQFQLRYH
jgi:chorismate synthase